MNLTPQFALGAFLAIAAAIVGFMIIAGLVVHDTLDDMGVKFCNDTVEGTPVVMVKDWPYEFVTRQECLNYFATSTAEAMADRAGGR